MQTDLIDLSYSSYSLFKTCRKAWDLRHNKGLVLAKESTARGIGSAVHKGLETGSIEKALALFDDTFPNDQKEQDNLEFNRAVVQAMLEGAFNLWGVDFADATEDLAELKFRVPIINPATGAQSKTFMLAGKCDRLVKIGGLWWLVEYKTSGKFDRSYVEKLTLDTQITNYIYGIQRVLNITIAGVIYRVLRKPSIRQRKDETFNQFLDRLVNDYRDRPDFYFYEESLFRSQDDLAEFEQELWDITQDILKCRRDGLWYRNTSRCLDWGRCDYMDLCTKKAGAITRYTTRGSNPELDEEEMEEAA